MEAITWLATNHPDLILLDYEMPITDGPQVLEMIWSKAATAMIPVMFLAGLIGAALFRKFEALFQTKRSIFVDGTDRVSSVSGIPVQPCD